MHRQTLLAIVNVTEFLLGLVWGFAAVAYGQTRPPALPLDPISAILDAFGTHPIVGLSEGQHNNEQAFAFRMALIRDPRFAKTVNDIVVESGSSLHQDVMDRFIRGEVVAEDELRRAWQDSTEAGPTWDVPMYEEFFREVRRLNERLPRARHIRVLLGDPPFDWDHATRDQWLQIGAKRDEFPATLIQREVIEKSRKALVIYGNNHLGRRKSSIGGRLVAACGPCFFSIWTHTSGRELAEVQPNVAKWPTPDLALIRNTVLGASPYAFALPGEGPLLEDHFDAVLYVGPVSKVTIRRGQISPELCMDADYLSMRLARMAVADPPGAILPPGVQSPSIQLREYCASFTTKEFRGPK